MENGKRNVFEDARVCNILDHEERRTGDSTKLLEAESWRSLREHDHTARASLRLSSLSDAVVGVDCGLRPKYVERSTTIVA